MKNVQRLKKINKRISIFSLLLLVSVLFIHSQTLDLSYKFISGVVLDKTGEPIIGVTIFTEGKGSVGTITDTKGKFSIKLSKEVRVLQISYVGYISQKVELNDKKTIEIILQENNQLLSEVVVVGYGSQKKESVTGSISTVSSADLIKAPVGNISNALVGRVAGLTAIQQSGEPGFDQASIRIRGIGTFAGDQNPLVVIDGIVQSLETMNMIDPNEIDKVNVLKDASATAVYGVRGANGVIIITTKKGRKGEPQISFTSNFGVMKPTTLASLSNSYEYAVLRNEAIKNDGLNQPENVFSQDDLWKFQNNRDYTSKEIAAMSQLTEAQKVALSNSPAMYYASHDYLKEIFNRTAIQQQYNINLSGGTDKVNYFVSVGYLNQEGLLNNFGIKNTAADTRNERITFRNNFDFNFIKNFEFNLSVSGYFTDLRTFTNDGGDIDVGSRYRDIIKNIYEAPPFAGPGVIDGKLVRGYAGYRPANNAGGSSAIQFLLDKAIANIKRNNLNISLKGKHTMDYLVKGLSLRGLVSYESNFSKDVNTVPNIPGYQVMRSVEDPNQLMFFGGQESNETITEKSFYKDYKFYVEGGIEYSRKFDKHTITALSLVTAERRTMPKLLYNIPQGMYGVVGRVTYGYDDRYLGEINMGYNGSENFAQGKRFGLFPAVSIGWIVTNESFFPKNDVVTWIKFRASYGQTGNSNIGGKRFMYLPGSWGSYSKYTLPFQGYNFGYSDGTYFSPQYTGNYELSVGNPNVTWEKKESSNIALDINFFKDKLSVSADLFVENRNNILTSLATVPGIIGIDSDVLPPENVGSMKNSGYEINVSWKDKIKDFIYQIGGQVSYAKNIITFKAEPPYPYSWMNETGYSFGQYKGYSNEGFYNSQKEAANHPFNTAGGNNAQAGDLRIIDVNGDGTVDDKDMIPSEYSNVPRFTFSTNFLVSYKGFEISTLFSGSAQGTFSMNGYMINPFSTGVGNTMKYIYEGRWTAERYASGQEITYPRVSMNLLNGTQNGINNSYWLRSTDHIKLKNVEIAYTFSKKSWIKKANLGSLRIYANANNLFTFKNKNLTEGIDPELIHDKFTSEGAIYPITRVINFGLKVQF